MSKTELTNMVMIHDKEKNRVVVQERVKNWKGIAFPGGHVEEGESFAASAIREIKEETGLSIYNLKLCGVMHWNNNQTFDRYIVFLYRTEDYSGTLLESTEEGRVSWVDLDKLRDMKLSENFKDYLCIFLEDTHSEAFCSWNPEKQEDFEYR